MRLGIRKIEYIDSALLHDFSCLSPGSSLHVADYIKSGNAFRELPFTPETGELEEVWNDGDTGQYSSFRFTASIRKDKDQYRILLQRLLGRKCVWRITLVSGLVYIIGSKEYVPKFTFSDSVSGLSSSEFVINLENESLHGLLLDI